MLAKFAEVVRVRTDAAVDGMRQQRCPDCVPTTPRATTQRWCPICDEPWRDLLPEEQEAAA
ncbi:hypothetical protein [Salinifilum aidingensis]